MPADEAPMSAEEWAALDAIEATMAQPPGQTSPTDTNVGNLAALLRATAPRADEQYRRRLRAALITAATQRRIPAPRFSRRQLLAAGLTVATLGGAALGAPQARAALSAVLGGGSRTRTMTAPVVERGTRLPLDLTADPQYWVGPEQAQRAYFLTNIYRERWAQRQQLQRPPQAGAVVTLPNGAQLPIPVYLPDPFRWQGITATNQVNVPSEYITEKNGGGGGSGLPWERFPTYNNTIGTYLIGGDPNDHFIILQQFRVNPDEAIIVSIFQMLVPTTVPPMGSPKAPPAAGRYGERTTLGIIVEPARDDHIGIAVQTGPGTLHAITVAGTAAWQFGGIWTAEGQWLNDGTWRSLVWSRDGYLYCLSAETLTEAELLRVAASLPALP
ncbi:MAG TPA: hypothetical protein VIL85_27260 [Thermomicrobiales bacterium]|jgi:hypothetical protein